MKDTTANIRVSVEKKKRWQEAAGGPRKLSAWLTDLADRAVEQSRAEVALRAQPASAERREGDLHEESVVAPGPLVQESSAGQCPRWMHHRSGVYCGTCKKVN